MQSEMMNNYQYPISNKPFISYKNQNQHGHSNSEIPVDQFHNMNITNQNSALQHQNMYELNHHPSSLLPNMSPQQFAQTPNNHLPYLQNTTISNYNPYDYSQHQSVYHQNDSRDVNEYNNNNNPIGAPGNVYQSPPVSQTQNSLTKSDFSSPEASAAFSNQRSMKGQLGSLSGNHSLNPDQLPSAVQVIELDKRSNLSPYPTGSRDRVPPLVTTDFVAQDQGTCNPKFIRSSLYVIPTTGDILKNIHIPFVLGISPFAQLHPSEQQIVCGETGEKGPIRCIRCKAYMNPFMTFIDGGQRFLCNLCGATNDVDEDYFVHIDQNGRRVDCYNRPELCLGSYEILATKEYCRNEILPERPAFIFMIDVSYNSLKSGLLHTFCSHFKETVLPYLATDSNGSSDRPLVGFITYDKMLHFYNLKSTLTKPQMHIVSCLESADRAQKTTMDCDLVPFIDGFLVDIEQAQEQITILMESLPETFSATEERNVILGPVIEAGKQALKVCGNRCGKLFVFHSSLPSGESVGKLKVRDEKSILGTDKEKNLFSPSSNYYTKLAESCLESGVSVDLFLTPNAFIDVATLSELPKLTGGNLYKYEYFTPLNHGEKFLSDLRLAVSQPSAFDTVMRVRTSLGTKTADFLGNFFMKNTEDVQMACMDCNKSIVVEIKLSDKLPENEPVFIQVAVLFTSLSGQRRLRIHNISFNTSSSPSEIFKLTDLDTIMNWMGRNSLRTFKTKSLVDATGEIYKTASQILASYRRNYGEKSKPAELILPETLKLLPVYANSVHKCDFMQSGTELSIDERAYQCFLFNGMDIKQSQRFLYPLVLPMTKFEFKSDSLPVAIRASYAFLESNGAYLIENGVNMYLWIGQLIDRQWLQQVFGCSSLSEISNHNRNSLPLYDNQLSQAVNRTVQIVRSSKSQLLTLQIVYQGDRKEDSMKKLLVEDSGEKSNSSYVDFLVFLHKEIRNILNY